MSAVPARMAEILEKEIETYNAKLPELLGSIGKFVLIKDSKVVGIYDTYADALKGRIRAVSAPTFHGQADRAR
jgi:hypothetical protein